MVMVHGTRLGALLNRVTNLRMGKSDGCGGDNSCGGSLKRISVVGG